MFDEINAILLIGILRKQNLSLLGNLLDECMGIVTTMRSYLGAEKIRVLVDILHWLRQYCAEPPIGPI